MSTEKLDQSLNKKSYDNHWHTHDCFWKDVMDIVGPLPETKSGNLYILTIQDNFTKYSSAIPLSNHQTSTIADPFVKTFICIFGSPKGVLTDQGTDFLNVFSYNTSVHEGTKCTPYKLVFGKLAGKPFSEPLSQQEKLQTYDDYSTTFVTQLHEMRTQERENLISAKEKSKIYYNGKINPLEVKIGDNVFLLKWGKIKKLDNNYTG